MAVFGRNTCFYCNKFKPVYNAVAEKYDLDIYYFDSDNYDSKEYSKIIKRPKYSELTKYTAEEVHNGYFSKEFLISIAT